MAITTLNGVIAGQRPVVAYCKASFTGTAIGNYYSSLYLAGLPGAGAAPSMGINGSALTTRDGQIPFPTTVGGQSIYCAGVNMMMNGIGSGYLCDLLWENSGIAVTTTTAQAITFPTLPARDLNGLTNGTGLIPVLEVVTTIGTAAPVTTCTISYTNEAGTAGRTGTLSSINTAASAGWTGFFDLAAGDKGVRSIQSITLGTSLVSGSVSLKLIRIVSAIPVAADNRLGTMDVVQLGMPIWYNTSVPYFIYALTSTSPGRQNGTIMWTQG